MPLLQCCCGRLDCEYLKHNNVALSGLEKEVETAAQLGQALLARHESYMADSESARLHLTNTLSQLEYDKRHLEAENARVIQENKDLLQQLEGMNSQIADSDTHIESLCKTLSEARAENERLMGLALRAEELERQIAELEGSRGRLMDELGEAREDERCAVDRWMGAERRLRGLSEQVERIEREARDERERHVEIVGRMERRREVEKELESAAGRLKGAAAASTLGRGRDKNGTNVVSHFVRDVLQDNANLQAGIVELRELLQTSNDEVQSLREQVLQHQPISREHCSSQPRPTVLSDEIEQSRPRAISQVHVHHHYHAKILAKKESRPTLRRPQRRRGLLPASSTSSTGCQTPLPLRGVSSTVLTLPRPPDRGNRWSTQSSATDFSNMSSLPSSPYSDHRSSSLFDRLESGFESSRPTSPESTNFAPRRFHFEQQRSRPDLSMGKCTELENVSEDEVPGRASTPSNRTKREKARQPLQILQDNIESEERISPLDSAPKTPFEGSQHPPQSSSDLATPDDELDPTHEHEHDLQPTEVTLDEFYFSSPRLQRSNSHESLLSISGMDIHLPKQPQHHRPSPAPPLRLLRKPSLTLDQMDLSIAFPSPQPLASIAEVNASASSTKADFGARSTFTTNRECLSPVSLLSGLASGKSQPGTRTAKGQGLGRLVGNWVGGGRGGGGNGGVMDMASMGDLREHAQGTATAFGTGIGSSTGARIGNSSSAFAIGSSTMGPARMPGINQKGPILGWRAPQTRTKSEVEPKVLDQDLLRESLDESS